MIYCQAGRMPRSGTSPPNGVAARDDVTTGEVAGRCSPGCSLEDVAQFEFGVSPDDDEGVNRALADHFQVLGTLIDAEVGIEIRCHVISDFLLFRGHFAIGVPLAVVSLDSCQILIHFLLEHRKLLLIHYNAIIAPIRLFVKSEMFDNHLVRQ